MSVISEKVRVGLFGKLNVVGVTTLATGGVFESLAPESTAKPYVIFQRQAATPVTYSFGPTQQLEDDLWLIKAVVDEDSNPAKSPQGLAEDILAACITALGTSMTLTGNTVEWFARFRDWEGYAEPSGDRVIFHRGFIWRIAVS